METQQPAGGVQNDQTKEWYRHWWGVVIAILILPVFAIWYVWTKSKLNTSNKWVMTVLIVVITLIAMASDGSSDKKEDATKSQQASSQLQVQETKSEVSVQEEIKDNQLSPEEITKKEDEEKPIETSTENSTALFKVSRVIDGDTLDIDMNGKIERIRLIGIDTPETVDPRKVVQCFGKEASDKAKEMLDGKMISIEADNSQSERDAYKRLLLYVYLEDGTFFNKYMIAEGYAHEYTYQSNPYKHQLEFKEAEKQAREAEKGLWSPDSCNGNTTQAVTVKSKDNNNTSETISPTTNNSGGAVVKKSKTGICHAPGTTYYNKTLNFTPYNSIDECLKSGGRLPKR